MELITSTDRWILKIVGSLVVAGILGGGITLNNLKTDVAVMKTEISLLNNQYSKASDKRYDSEQAAADKQVMMEFMKTFNKMVERNEHRIDRLESKVYNMDN